MLRALHLTSSPPVPEVAGNIPLYSEDSETPGGEGVVPPHCPPPGGHRGHFCADLGSALTPALCLSPHIYVEGSMLPGQYELWVLNEHLLCVRHCSTHLTHADSSNPYGHSTEGYSFVLTLQLGNI